MYIHSVILIEILLPNFLTCHRFSSILSSYHDNNYTISWISPVIFYQRSLRDIFYAYLPSSQLLASHNNEICRMILLSSISEKNIENSITKERECSKPLERFTVIVFPRRSSLFTIWLLSNWDKGDSPAKPIFLDRIEAKAVYMFL